MTDLSLFEFLNHQLGRLCAALDADWLSASQVLAELLGPIGARDLRQPPPYPSGVADDHTPVEFSIAFNESELPTLRILAEALAPMPSAAANLSAAQRFVRTQAARFGIPLAQFDQLSEVFAADDPHGGFGMWHSIIFRPGAVPEFKVYFNPEARGVDAAPALVAEALERLGLVRSYHSVLAHATRPGELGRGDRLTFFALDLHDGLHSRVKLYFSHHDAQMQDVVRAAGAVDGVDRRLLAEFCDLAGGGTAVFADRPLVSSYTFLGEGQRPVGYSVYVPIRDYVSDDDEARARAALLLDRYGFDSRQLDRAIAAVAHRPLSNGVGLIAHVALRLGPPRPGVTVYLSAEAYQVVPPRVRPQPVRDLAQSPADCHAP